ncbi:MAG: hypothetical protein V1851_00055 [Patescibacteria group bacterium]
MTKEDKQSFQDVTPPKRSIHDIPIPNGKDKEAKKLLKKKTKKGWGFKFLMILLVLVLALFAFFSLMASTVTISVEPKTYSQRTDASFIAISKNETGGVPFDIIMLDETKTGIVDATGQESVKEKARGQIIIFNNESATSQRLIKNTRFETPEGLIFRIADSIVVPGQTKDAEGKTIPGSIEVTVFADQPGEKYNIELTDFTIPGFKGTDRFNYFYARSKTAMTGGFEGIKKVASEQDIEAEQAKISEELITKLKEDIRVQLPEGFILYENGLFTKSEFLGTVDSDEGVGIQEKVTLYAVIFNEKNLSKYVAENTLEGYKGEDILISNLKDLEFEIKNREDVSPWSEGRFVFSLKGLTNFEWLFDAEELKNDFVGKDKDSINEILSAYENIKSADVIIKPFWKQSFPRSTGNIEVVKKLEK